MIFFNKVLVTNKKKVFVFLDELKGKSLLEKKESRGELMMLQAVWYMCLKTENCCLKIFIEIRVGEKVR